MQTQSSRQMAADRLDPSKMADEQTNRMAEQLDLDEGQIKTVREVKTL
jgi:hypothetical protein